MFENFPKYTDYDPKMPVWCVTPNRPGCMQRFFDTPPISPSGKYLAVFQLPHEDRPPKVGEAGNVCIVDLESGEDRVVAATTGWEPQMGANINWGASDNELFFNDVDSSNSKPFAWKLNPLTGEKQKMQSTVYHASPDGKWLISANMTKMRKTQPGYGVVIDNSSVRENIGLVDDDGFYLTDTSTGECRMLASIRDMFTKASPAIQIDDPDKYEIYGFHSKFNPQGDRLMLSLRWFPHRDEPTWNMFKIDHDQVRFAWVTMDLDGGNMHCAVGPEQWEKGGHHATWYPDGKQISMNLNIDREMMRFVKVNDNGSGLQKIVQNVQGSGHPTITPDGRYILTDTYFWESFAYGDGTTPLRWVNIQSEEETTIARIYTQHNCPDSVMRIDPHPAWDRNYRYVTFNTFTGGTRRVFIADMKELMH